VLYVDDLLAAFEAVSASPAAYGEVFNVGGGPQNAVSLLELMEKIKALSGEKLSCLAGESRPGDQLIYVTDHRKLSSITGWKPQVSVDQTLRSLYDWRKRNKGLFEEPSIETSLLPGSLDVIPEAA
jgi:CDP-paratose 2-epimerase